MRSDASLDDAHADPHAEDAPAGFRVEDAPYRYPYADPPSSGRRAFWWVVVLAIVAALFAAGYYYWTQRPAAIPANDVPPPRAETAPAPSPRPEPAIQHPIEAAKPEADVAAAPATPLPALDVSDRPVEDALAGLVDRGTIGEYLSTPGLVRRIVVTVDNLPRKKAPQRLWPVKPTEGKFLVAGAGDAAYVAADNARRYEPFLRVMESIDTGKLVALYVRFYPLFQQAYRELGYPQGYFNDRLVEVIDHLLLTPEIGGPIKLTKPWIMYEFADPALEARSSGQKALIRMGPANAQRVKAKLRDFRRQIAGRPLNQ